MSKTNPDPAKIRSLYRSLLRELPPRPILARPRIPIHSQLRKTFIYLPKTQASPSEKQAGIALAEQYKSYFQAQRHYVSLIEQYNPGMGMSTEERVRLSARRVGMNLPHQFEVPKDPKQNECKPHSKSEYNVDEHWMPAERLRSIDRSRMEKREQGTRNHHENKRRQKMGKIKRLLAKTYLTLQERTWLDNEIDWARKRAAACGSTRWEDFI
ncbi:hypothetical protein V8F33_004325 [Rhypophila sp. PSN 637]